MKGERMQEIEQALNVDDRDRDVIEGVQPESPTGMDEEDGLGGSAPAAGDTGDLQATQPEGEREIGPVPYRRFQQVNERLRRAEQELRVLEQLREHPAVQAALGLTPGGDQAAADGIETGPDPYEGFLQTLSEAEAGTPIEQAVKALLPGIVQENRALRSDLQGVRQAVVRAEAEQQAQLVDSAISDAAQRYGMGDLDDDSKVSLVEEAYTIMLGADSAGRQLTMEEAFDRAARILQPETSAQRRRETDRQIDEAKAGMAAGRPGGVRGPVNSTPPVRLSRQEIFERNYRLAGGG
ncbi:MAG TPA: hypothetical protein VHS28_06180 [Chloroflexota bacterium]|nr:hypothetical protein [Chloroflexota bacterium]